MSSSRGNQALILILVFGLFLVLALVLLLFSSEKAIQAPRSSTQKESVSHKADEFNNSFQDETITPIRSKKGPIDSNLNLRSSSKGVIHFLVKDALTGKPLKNLEYLIYREQSGYRLKASGRTDDQGAGSCEGLYGGGFHLQTERRPPNCHGFASIWLDGGEVKEIVVPVGRGGKAMGRVQDDLKQPIQHAKVWVKTDAAGDKRILGWPEKESRVLAKTDKNGFFEVDCLFSLPKTGDKEINDSQAVLLLIKSPEGGADYKRIFIKEGETKDLGDIIIQRSRHYSGRVINEAGHPVVGALVSSTTTSYKVSNMKFAPWLAGFTLNIGDSITDDAGHFFLSKPGTRYFRGEAFVWTKEGRQQYFDLPRIDPGASKDGLEFIMKEDTLLELVFKNPDGSKAQIRQKPSLQLLGSKRIYTGVGRINVEIHYQDNQPFVTFRKPPDPDGIIRIPIDHRKRVPETLVIHVPGYLQIMDQLDPNVSGIIQRTYTLKKMPTLTLQLDWTPQSIPLLTPSNGFLKLHACRFPPNKFLTPNSHLLKCCGLGGRASFPLTNELQTAELWVNTQEPYWIHVEPNNKKVVVTPNHFGPFTPGALPHRITVSLEKGEDNAIKAKGKVKFKVINSASGEPVDANGYFKNENPNENHGKYGFDARTNGLVLGNLPEGLWSVNFSTQGYGRKKQGPYPIQAGKELDLGTISIEPLPVYKGVLLTANGEPAAEGAYISCENDITQVQQGGGFCLHLELKKPDYLKIDENRIQSPRGVQWIKLDSWPLHETKRFFLKPWCDIEVNIHGVPVKHLQSDFNVYLKSIENPNLSQWGRESKISVSGVKTFIFRLSEGQYQLHIDSIYAVPDKIIQVKSHSSSNKFDVYL